MSIWPKALIEIMHHAVVKKGNGDLVDITRPEYETNFVSFVKDSSITPPLDYPIYIPNKFIPLVDSKVIDMRISNHFEQMKLKRKFREIQKEQGIPFVPGGHQELKIPAELVRQYEKTREIVDITASWLRKLGE